MSPAALLITPNPPAIELLEDTVLIVVNPPAIELLEDTRLTPDSGTNTV